MTLLELGYPNISKSITNPDVSNENALDFGEPLSLIEFIRMMDVSYNPSKNQEYYNAYLKSWNNTKKNKDLDDRVLIVERYRQFIQDVNLNYITPEEKKFLSNLNFNDPLDLDIAIPFYSRKLIEISQYYNSKREETKAQVNKNKTLGTLFRLENDVSEITTNFLNNLENWKTEYGGISNIEVEIEELYESYPEYFNQDPDSTYDNKDLDYGLDIFLRTNDDLVSEVFSGVSTDIINLKEGYDLFDNKRKLTEKYIATDYYYLSTGSTVFNFVSGKILDADNPASSFLNIKYPTTASTQRKEFKTPSEIGYFRPHKTSIVLIDGEKSTFSFNFNNLEPNKIYYFPDPNIRNTNEKFLTFINNDISLKKNDSSGSAKNQPISKKEDSQYFGYISKKDENKDKYLDQIFESGYISDSKFDIYNNQYGLFKNDGSFKKTIETINTESDYYYILNGHTFYDFTYGEGYAFDYTTIDDSTYQYTTRSGLSTHTGKLSTDFSRHYILFGGKFDTEFKFPPDYFPACQILEGYRFQFNGGPVTDDISSDLSAYPSSGSFYYSRLIEGGVHDLSPLQRALTDPLYPTLSANATLEIISDDINTFMFDGGVISDTSCDIKFELPKIYYDPTVLENSSYVLSSETDHNLYERLSSSGMIYVKNSHTKEVKPLTNHFKYLSTTLSTPIYQSLSSVNSFEIVGDVMFVETENYFIIQKILFEEGEFINPKKTTHTHTFNSNPYQKISKRFKKGNKVYYVLVDVETYPIPDNNFKIYPLVYEFDLNKFSKKIFTPITSEYGVVSGGSDTYTKSEQGNLTFNPRKNQFTLSFLLKTDTKKFIIQDFDFKINPFSIINHTQTKQ